MQMSYWNIDLMLEREAIENYRTRYALSLKDRDPLTIIRELTFDGVSPRMTVADIDGVFDYVEQSLLKRKIAGVGLEVGAGPLTFSSVLARRPAVQRMYGVEICKPLIELLAPKVSEYVAKDTSDKITGVVGSFDEMELSDRSIDFVFDFFSLHHSTDISVTLAECARVLKPGGFLLMMDKARPDSFSERDLRELTDQEYTESYKKQFGLPVDQKLTRWMNGEREYRLKDWKSALFNSGFSRIDHFNLQQTSGGGSLNQMLKKALSLLPIWLQTKANLILPQHRPNHKFIHSSDHRVHTSSINVFRKEISVIIAYK